MPASGHSRHFDSAPRTSVLPRSADIANPVRQVRKVPEAEVAVSSVWVLRWTTNYWTRGSLTLNDAPPWSRFLAHISPLCASILVRAMDNPMPMPSALLV